jgi:anti-sigma B factor antagonist
MKLDITPSGSSVIVSIDANNLDASNIKAFKDAMQPVIEAHSRIILDLARVGFVDSSGLGALLACLRKITELKGGLKVCGLTRPVRALFELMRMHRVFALFDTVDDALKMAD